MTPVKVTQGRSAIVLGQPHGGTFVPPDILDNLNRRGRGLADTDWHINRLYHDLLPEITVVEARFHRYVIDANRDPAGGSLYPGQNTTGLCPLTDFDGRPIWNHPPDTAEEQRRLARFHAPYHAALSAEIARVKALHGFAILFDCHSIRSRIPFLFEGDLPVFSIGTNNGTTCDPRVEKALVTNCQQARDTDYVVNGRFKGGWTTRAYGQPQNGVHAIQLELAQRAYMQEAAPWEYSEPEAAKLRASLGKILRSLHTLSLA